MRQSTILPSKAQLEIIKVVWRLGETRVRDVYEDLRIRRSIAYTTVMTMMKKMESKGLLIKRSDGKAFVYKAATPKSRMLKQIVDDFIDGVFNGSEKLLLEHMVEERLLSEKMIEKVIRMIRDKNRQC